MAIYRVPIVLAWNGSGSPGVNVWHCRTVGPSHSVDLQNAVDALRVFYNSVNDSGTGSSAYPAGFTANIGQVSDVVTQEAAAPTFTTITGPAASTDRAPMALQICVSWKTSIAARRGRGRTFLGPLYGATLDTDGTPDANTLTRLRNAASALVTASEAATGWAWGVYGLESPAPAGTLPGTPAYEALPRVLRDFIGSSVSDKFAVLRSRRD